MADETCVLITGAGAGLGRALSKAFVARKIPVVGVGRSEETLTETRNLIGSSDLFEIAVADVSDASAVAGLFSKLDQQNRPITILINNAAIYEKADFLDISPQDWMRSVAINLGGMVNCTSEALARMVKNGKGRIVNVTSFADMEPIPCSSAYAVSKGAGRIFTRALCADFADRFPDIVINDWNPGVLKTAMGEDSGAAPELAAQWGLALALQNDPALNGLIFVENREFQTPRGLKAKLKDMLLLKRRPPPRILGSASD